MRILNKYRLELHWDRVEYLDDQTSKLEGAYFSGPVLKQAAKIAENDQLIVDLTHQHLLFVPDYYQAVLKWGTVEYKDDKVLLSDAIIRGRYVNSLEKLGHRDWLMIDCTQHEEKKHPYHLVYWAEVRKQDGGEKY